MRQPEINNTRSVRTGRMVIGADVAFGHGPLSVTPGCSTPSIRGMS